MVLHLLLIRGAARFAVIRASAFESTSDGVGNDPVAEVGQGAEVEWSPEAEATDPIPK
jgi:hypothetical protein